MTLKSILEASLHSIVRAEASQESQRRTRDIFVGHDQLSSMFQPPPLGARSLVMKLNRI